MDALTLRPACERDRTRLHEILVASGRFSDEEIGWAGRTLDDALSGERGAQVVVAELDGTVAGWAAWQPLREIRRTVELCWISVDPSLQRQGIGTSLIEAVEKYAREAGEWVLVETRLGKGLDNVRGFYEGRGYTEISRVVDFRRQSDDRLILMRHLD